MRIQHLTKIAAAAATGRREALASLYEAALQDGVAAADLQEATLQVYLFAGFPRTIEAFAELGKVVDSPPPTEDPPADPGARGEVFFRRLYADRADTVLALLESLHPDFARFTLEHAYGQVMSRPFLDEKERELLAVAMLAPMGLGAPLRAHVRGALRCGATHDEVRQAAAGEQVEMIDATLASFRE